MSTALISLVVDFGFFVSVSTALISFFSLVVAVCIEPIGLIWLVASGSFDERSGVKVSSIGLISEGSTCVCLEISISPLYIHTLTPIRPYSVWASAIE